jgi:hypothetical protein
LLGAKTGFALHGRELELAAEADADGAVWVCAARTQMDTINTKARKKNPALVIPGSLSQFVVMSHSILPVSLAIGRPLPTPEQIINASVIYETTIC